MEDSTMTLESLTPMLRTWNLRATIAFYTDVLGFTCENVSDEWGWASLKRDGVNIMLSRPNEHEGDKAPAFTGSLYIKTSNTDGLWESLKEKARVCYPLDDLSYGMREFAIYDNNGYVLQFGQPLTAKH
jgi:uncharacterized glyoxalase superfamily protein PhnB